MTFTTSRVLRAVLGAAVALAVAAGTASASHRTADHDHDGLPDRWERARGLGGTAGSALGGPDHDGLWNISEYRAGTRPGRRDTDRDGVPDAAEDRDGDGVANLAEQRLGTRPDLADSDGDGIPDGRETVGPTRQVTGTVVVFEPGTGTLIVQPAAGGTALAVQVDGATRLVDLTPATLAGGIPVTVDYAETAAGALVATRVQGPAPAPAPVRPAPAAAPAGGPGAGPRHNDGEVDDVDREPSHEGRPDHGEDGDGQASHEGSTRGRGDDPPGRARRPHGRGHSED